MLVACGATHVAAQPSVLHQGFWLKVEIEKAGVYRIDYNQLKNAGADVAGLDPRTLKVYGNPGGMLPQANAAARPVDLIENAIVVSGESDGVFGAGDHLLFYAQGADLQRYDVERSVFQYEQNLYATRNYVFITYGGEPGKRVAQAETVQATAVVDEYEDVYHYEQTVENLLKSGREWYGDRFRKGDTREFSFSMEGIKESSTIRVVSDVVAYSIDTSTSFELKLNGQSIGTQVVAKVLNTQYGDKARHRRDTFLVPAQTVTNASRVNHTLSHTFAHPGTAYGFLDFVTVTATRKLALYTSQTVFRSQASLAQASSAFSIDRATSATQVWDVTDPTTPTALTVQLTGSTAIVRRSTTTLKEFVAFNQPLSPGAVTKIQNQNIRETPPATLLIVTDKELKSEAQRLANHRQSFSGISVQVVTVNDIFNEFSSGRPDVSAIRDFVRYQKNRYPAELKYLLLFGRGTYDYKNVIRDNINRVLTYESRNSIHPVDTYSSDDYFGLLEDHEGTWSECSTCIETLDIGVGRIPVKHAQQATFIVDKLIRYDLDVSHRGPWQSRISFVADDGDLNTHQAQADVLANYIEQSSAFSAKKIYLDAFEQISRPAGQIAPIVNTTIKDLLQEGTVILNYTGHGNEYQWANEKILDELLITGTDNDILPFLVTATCEFGRHDDPIVTSVAEIALLRKSYGVIGLVTTARPVNSVTNFDLNEAFYDALLQRPGGEYQTVGDIFKATKNNSAFGVSNRNFSLLGDPSMHLAFPQQDIQLTSVSTDADTDTLRALATVEMRGIVLGTSGEKDESFDGTLEATVYDKAPVFTTLGNENTPFSFRQWSSVLFRGRATVESGEFVFSFQVPKSIAYAVGDGRVSLYARSSMTTAGGSASVKVGGSASPTSVDTTPPQLQAFMNDTTFIQGGKVGPDTRLVVRLFDASGISITNTGVGNDLSAELDNSDEVYELSNHFIADADDFKRGTISFPLYTLSPGYHRIRVMAWDTHNNPAEAFVEFVVTDGESITIDYFGGSPNPFSDQSRLVFTHSAAGEDLRAEVVFYGSHGNEVARNWVTVDNSNFEVELATLEGDNLPPGVYVARLFLRSISTGNSGHAQTRLIKVN